MKLDDAVNGALAILLGAAIIAGSRGLATPAHSAYGPGLFPMLAGIGFMLAGASLVLRRLWLSRGAVEGLVRLRGEGMRGAVGFALIVGSIFVYILLADRLGFLLVAPVLLFVLILWFDRRPAFALVGALAGTLVFHVFFYQLMSAPLPWGILIPWSGLLTW